MTDEIVKIKDSKTGKIFKATKTKSGYTRGGRTVRLSSTQKEYTTGAPVKPKKKSPAPKKVKGADMNAPSKKYGAPTMKKGGCSISKHMKF
jgi:hypothetical protein